MTIPTSDLGARMSQNRRRGLTPHEAEMALQYVQRVVARGPHEENELWMIVQRLSEIAGRRRAV